MKPLIGITAKFSDHDDIGIITNLGCKDQYWFLLADDYIKAIEETGGIPIILPVLAKDRVPEGLIDKLDGIIFSGGNDIDPKHYGAKKEIEYKNIIEELDQFEMELYKKVLLETEMPILGICRGIQLINTAHGGTLFQEMRMGTYEKHIYSKEPLSKMHIAHDVSIEEDTLLFDIIDKKSIPTNSFHHQSIDLVGKGLKVNAVSEDGIIEGVEALNDHNTEGRFLLGVQWHPEMLAPPNSSNDVHSKNIFKYFVEESLKYKEGKGM